MAKWFHIAGAVACFCMVFMTAVGFVNPWWMVCGLWGFHAVGQMSEAYKAWLKEDERKHDGWHGI